MIPFRVIVGHALCRGAISWWLRPGRSGGGFRVVALFLRREAAAELAIRAAGLVGRSVVVRPRPSGGWVVSVPVAVPSRSLAVDWGAWESLS